MTSHFHIICPAVVSFSGGRSSGLMLRRILDAYSGRLPSGLHIVFANTGRERPETLDFVRDCASRWGVRVRWVERRGARSSVCGATWVEVDHESAARNGEPFAELIRERRFLPNAAMRFCTTDLKIEVMRAFMHAQGYDAWTNVVGLRRDEPARVGKLRAREQEWDVACPLYDAGITNAAVRAFWRAQPFNLRLDPWEGNCDLCFLKGRGRRERIMRDRPDLASWWVAQEATVGGRFHAHEPGYAATLERVRRLPMLPMDLDVEADGCTSGACTDRRRPPCGCRDIRRNGHALACEHGAFGRAA